MSGPTITTFPPGVTIRAADGGFILPPELHGALMRLFAETPDRDRERARAREARRQFGRFIGVGLLLAYWPVALAIALAVVR